MEVAGDDEGTAATTNARAMDAESGGRSGIGVSVDDVKMGEENEQTGTIGDDVAMGEENEPPPVPAGSVSNGANVTGGAVPAPQPHGEEGPTLLDAWAMFGEALFGDAIGVAAPQRLTGEVHPRGLFAQPRPTANQSRDSKMALAGVGWEEGDDPALSWTSELPTTDLSANFAAALPSFADILKHRGITTGKP